ncbi:hypothetical protein DFJ77DRAFT_107098 [Powellomyces hirtus]|nr:hypothetical protein DFJ77DRAFT_107098 [Powellomyces hirtus]
MSKHLGSRRVSSHASFCLTLLLRCLFLSLCILHICNDHLILSEANSNSSSSASLAASCTRLSSQYSTVKSFIPLPIMSDAQKKGPILPFGEAAAGEASAWEFFKKSVYQCLRGKGKQPEQEEQATHNEPPGCSQAAYSDVIFLPAHADPGFCYHNLVDPASKSQAAPLVDVNMLELENSIRKVQLRRTISGSSSKMWTGVKLSLLEYKHGLRTRRCSQMFRTKRSSKTPTAPLDRPGTL